MVRLGSFK
jgi:hypothetical protein